jgi:hypothetical protein
LNLSYKPQGSAIVSINGGYGDAFSRCDLFLACVFDCSWPADLSNPRAL